MFLVRHICLEVLLFGADAGRGESIRVKLGRYIGTFLKLANLKVCEKYKGLCGLAAQA